MLYQLGELQFNFNKNPIEQLETSVDGNWNVAELIGGAPYLYKMPGQVAVQEYTFSCQLIMQNTNVVNKLKEMTLANETYDFIDGEGSLIGNFAIKEFKIKDAMFIDGGLPRIQEIDLTLIKNGN